MERGPRAADDVVVSDFPNMALTLANYYSSVDEPHHFPRRRHFFQATAAHKKLSTSPTVMGPGQNQFRPFMLQILTGLLGEPIPAMLNKPLKSGLVSQDWRKAIVCPTFKKGTHRMRPFTAL